METDSVLNKTLKKPIKSSRNAYSNITAVFIRLRQLKKCDIRGQLQDVRDG